MPRVKRGTQHTKRRKKILRKAKGYSHQRKTHLRQAKQAIRKAGQYAYRDRRKKKAIFRGLWSTQLSAALKTHDLSYSTFMHLLKERNIALNRKMLASLAKEAPDVLTSIVKKAQNA